MARILLNILPTGLSNTGFGIPASLDHSQCMSQPRVRKSLSKEKTKWDGACKPYHMGFVQGHPVPASLLTGIKMAQRGWPMLS